MARLKKERPLALQWLTLAAAVILLTLGLVAIVAGPAVAEQFATLSPLEGVVQVAEDGGEFREGRTGQVLGAGDVVRTGSDGRAEIEYFDDSVTRLDVNTTFELEELSSDPDVPGSKTIVGHQEQGRTFERVVAITDSESRFDVETPSATASVQGTTYVLFQNPDGSLSLWVLPDTDPGTGEVVLILPDGSEILVLEGQGVLLFPDGSAGEPFTLTEQHLNDPWVLFNECDLDELDLPECQEEEPPPPEEPEEPEEPEPSPEPPPPPPPSVLSSTIVPTTTTTTTTGGDGDTSDGDGEPEDTKPPKTTITEAPAQLTRSKDATFRFSANEPVKYFECSLDGGSYGRCTSGRTYVGLGDGTHLFSVRATDKAGNTENTASHQWTIDTTPPDTIIDSGPGEDCFESEGTVCPGDSATFTFHATEEGSTFECTLEESSVTRGGSQGAEPCTSPVTYEGLNDFSEYTFSVTATDRAGNTDPTPAEESWFVCSECGGGDRRGRGAGNEADAPGSSTITDGLPGGQTIDPVDDVVGQVEDAVEAVEDTVEDVTDQVTHEPPGLPDLPLPTPSLGLLDERLGT